jgi:uncharacterized membrane protein YoaK (UPF0700 family)
MSKSTFRYLIATALLALAGYEAFKQSWWEVVFYVVAAGAFASMALVSTVQDPARLRMANMASWVLIILSVLLFLFLVRTDG